MNLRTNKPNSLPRALILFYLDFKKYKESNYIWNQIYEAVNFTFITLKFGVIILILQLRKKLRFKKVKYLV